mmetsp:Transcript_13882/g.32965  ORF Transcript_13882/g.32965 Transcript_13882/m.32965 type:complete len:550 (-) Transcript_13882:235-1884(-)
MEVRQLLANLQDLRVVPLKLLHPVVDFGTLLATVADKELLDAVGGPVELGEPRPDLPVQCPDVVVEEPPLFGKKCRHDLIVVAYHPQHVLPQDPELVAVPRQLVGRVGHHDTTALNLLPVIDLLKHLEQLLVEVALQEGHLELARGLLGLHQQVDLEPLGEILVVHALQLSHPVLEGAQHEGLHVPVNGAEGVPAALLLSAPLQVAQLIELGHLLLDAEHQTPHCQRWTSIGWMTLNDGQSRRLPELVELFLDVVIQLRQEDVVQSLPLFLHKGLHTFSLGQLVEAVKDLAGGLNRANALERAIDHIHVHDLEISHLILEGTEMVRPLWRADIQDIIVNIGRLQALQILQEVLLDLVERVANFTCFGAAEGGHRLAAETARELLQALADLQEIAAALDKGVDLQKDAALRKVPWSVCVLGQEPHGLLVGALPLPAAVDALLQLHHGALHLAREDVRELDGGLAPLDDFIAHLPQESRDSVLLLVMRGDGPNHTYIVEQLRQDGGDLWRRGRGQFLTRLLQKVQEPQILLRLNRSVLDVLLQRSELLEPA